MLVCQSVSRHWAYGLFVAFWPQDLYYESGAAGASNWRLALADATVPQIATFTGHSLRDVEPILAAHNLGRDVKLAEIAIMKLETRTRL